MAKKQSDGRYRAKITIGTGADGKPIHKYVSGRTQRELEEAKVTARRHYVDGAVNRKDELLGSYLLEWYKIRKEPTIKESTKVNYRACLNKHIIPIFGDRNLRAIRAIELQQWLNEYAGSSKTTISLLLSIMKNVFSCAVSEGILKTNPAISLIKPHAKKAESRRALTEAETIEIERTIAIHKEGFFLAILYYLGLRRGEALGLQWGDFKFTEGLVHIQRDIDYSTGNGEIDSLKTDESDRFVTIPSPLLPMLINRRGSDHELLFSSQKGEILSYNSYRRMWIRLMIEAGIARPVEEQQGKDILDLWETEITPHYLRHNYITKLWEGGVDIEYFARREPCVRWN